MFYKIKELNINDYKVESCIPIFSKVATLKLSANFTTFYISHLNKYLFYLPFCLSLFFSCKNNKEEKQQNISQEPKLFSLLPAEQTGVSFQNELIEGPNTNILMYEYFYNGGGVATGDFNGDSLEDLYFTSNMGENKFYQNKGNLKFLDVTEATGAGGRPGPWKTGVSTVDINSDGKLDLYLCYSGAMPTEKRANQLFVNQGNDSNGVPKFIDKAVDYGLASEGYSNQGYFFDYDRDGDLDMALLNHNPKNLPILNEQSNKDFQKKDDPDMGLRIFNQSNGKFKDVTTITGVNGSALSYGLGLGIADLNNDGWLDFYVSNDYAVPDYLYVNNRNGTFTNTINDYIGHNSQFSMGNDIADVNNDGFSDIFTLDMLPEDNHRQKLLIAPDNFNKFDLNVRSGFGNQYMRNMLQLNNGNNTFSEIGQLAGISNTDWSWSALFADFDNDGWKDLSITNGYKRDYTNQDFIKYMDDYTKEKGRLVRADVQEIIEKMPASNVVNYIFKNKNGLSFTNETKSWGLDLPSNSNGAVYTDLDNDGDLDLVINNINQPAFVYQNDAEKIVKHNYLKIQLNGNEGNTQGLGAQVTLFSKGKIQSLMQNTARGYLSAVSPILHFGLGGETNVDSIRVVWNSTKKQTIKTVKVNYLLKLDEKNANDKNENRLIKNETIFTEIPSKLNFIDIETKINDFDRQNLMINQLSFSGPCLAKGDLNGDKLEDIFVGGSVGNAASLYLQQKNESFIEKKISLFIQDKQSHDVAASIFDANGDGFNDIYVASGGYHTFSENDQLLQDRLYLNDGKGSFTKGVLPIMLSSKSCVAVDVLTGNVFVGGRVIPGKYPASPESYLLQKGNNNELKAINCNFGMVTDAKWIDLNNDKKSELVVVGEYMPIAVYSFENNKLVNKTDQYFNKQYIGFWNKIETGDFNKDGKPDFIIANWGLNSQLNASETEPIETYFKDFDSNGSIEPIMCKYTQGKTYPFITRDELLNQISGFRAKYPNYESYSDVTYEQIFDQADLSNVGHLSANTLKSALFLSDKSGKFNEQELPIQAQYSPVYAISILDFNNDGNLDALLLGNNHKVKIRLGQMDANYGVLLQGDGKGGFQYISQTKSGLNVKGDVRSVLNINKNLIMGLNGRKALSFKMK